MDSGTDQVGAQVADIREFGSTVLRQAWPLDKLAQLRLAILECSDRRRARVAAGRSRHPHDKMYATHGVGTFASLLEVGLLEPQFLADLFVGSAYHQLCRRYFEDEAFFVVFNRLGFRDHRPTASDRSFIPYHQDSYTQDPRTPRVLNCWIPLDDGAGRDAPGLEVVRHPCAPDFPRKDFGLRSENAAYDYITIDRDEIVAAYGENFLAPEFDLGDSLVFSENVIHRTYVTPATTKPRVNFELRIFTPRHLAPGARIEDFGDHAFRVA